MSKKDTFMKVSNSIGLPTISRWMNRKDIIVLMYHGVSRSKETIGDWLQVEDTKFYDQMKHLSEHYNVVHLDDALNKTEDKRPKVVITFDDGYANNYSTAFPILKEFNLPATIFLVTGVIGTDHMFWYDRLQAALHTQMSPQQLDDVIESFKVLHSHEIDFDVDTYLEGLHCHISPKIREVYHILNMDEINEMADSGLIRFGSHTHEHELLTTMSYEECETSITKSINVLKNNIPAHINWFCYPNGWYDEGHVHSCEWLGFKGAVTTERGVWKKDTSVYEIPRLPVGRPLKFNTFVNMVSGVLKYLK